MAPGGHVARALLANNQIRVAYGPMPKLSEIVEAIRLPGGPRSRRGGRGELQARSEKMGRGLRGEPWDLRGQRRAILNRPSMFSEKLAGPPLLNVGGPARSNSSASQTLERRVRLSGCIASLASPLPQAGEVEQIVLQHSQVVSRAPSLHNRAFRPLYLAGNGRHELGGPRQEIPGALGSFKVLRLRIDCQLRHLMLHSP